MTKKTIEPRYDTTGKEIQLHDVLKDEETGEMALVVSATNRYVSKGLAVENKIIGIGDWLDVYPNGFWTIVGNAGIPAPHTKEQMLCSQENDAFFHTTITKMLQLKTKYNSKEKTNMGDLKKLKEDTLAYNERVKTNGGSIKEYDCPDCGKTLETTAPTKKGESWDSAVTCYECGKLHFYVKTIDGVTAKSMSEKV